MPSRPLSHEQRLRLARPDLTRADSRTDRARRLADPGQRELDRLRGTQRWKRLRTQVLTAEPLCRPCRAVDVTSAAVDVDHLVAALERPDLFFDLANLQPICRPCHARKGAAERAARGPRTAP